VANKAKSLFSEMMGYLNSSNITALKNLLEQNDDWMGENLKATGGSVWDGPGTGIKKG
jgi:hypothetical protein